MQETEVRRPMWEAKTMQLKVGSLQNQNQGYACVLPPEKDQPHLVITLGSAM